MSTKSRLHLRPAVLVTVVITAIYVRRANSEFDDLTKQILEDAAK